MSDDQLIDYLTNRTTKEHARKIEDAVERDERVARRLAFLRGALSRCRTEREILARITERVVRSTMVRLDQGD